MGRKGPINCQSHFTIPSNTKPGIYALYWVWDFTKLTAIDPSYLELYTSCMDVEVVAANGSSNSPASSSNGRKSIASKSATAKSKNSTRSTTKVTQTRHHTKTVTAAGTTVTEKANAGPSGPKSGANIVYTTIYTETFVTVTRTV
jgi:hypothetical protein